MFNSSIANNSASHGGAQVYSTCTGDFSVRGSTITMSPDVSQVDLPLAGNFSVAKSLFQCSVGAQRWGGC